MKAPTEHSSYLCQPLTNHFCEKILRGVESALSGIHDERVVALDLEFILESSDNVCKE
jgi:hypothetical protein